MNLEERPPLGRVAIFILLFFFMAVLLSSTFFRWWDGVAWMGGFFGERNEGSERQVRKGASR